MRRLLITAIAVVLPVGLAAMPMSASAIAPGTDVTGPLGLTCEFTHDQTDSLDYWLCGGKKDSGGPEYYGRSWGPNGNLVNSWDGTPLDTDVTLPANALTANGSPSATFPLMV